MALLHLEGFEGITPVWNNDQTSTVNDCQEYLRANYAGRFSDSSTNFFHLLKSQDGRGHALAGARAAGGASMWLAMYFPTVGQTDSVIVGMRIKTQNTDRGNEILRILGNKSGGSAQMSVWIGTSHTFQVRRGTGTTLQTTAADAFAANEWGYLEFKVNVQDGANGSYDLKWNGSTVLSDTLVDTMDQTTLGFPGGILIWSPNGSGDAYEEKWLVDDVYICDSTGTLNNDFLGAIKIHRLPVVSNGSNNNFSTFGGKPRFKSLNNVPVDDSLGIQSVDTATNKQTMKYHPFHTGSIVGVTLGTRSKTLSGGHPIQVKHRVDSGASSNNAQNITVLDNTDWTEFKSHWEVDPNTSAAWTQTNLNAAEFGVEIG